MKKYTIEGIEGNDIKADYYEVVITGDANDADYVTEESMFSQEEFDGIVDELIHLTENHSDRHEMTDYSWDADDGGDLYVHLPRTSWGDYCHTLIDIEIIMHDQDGVKYEVYL